MEIELDMQQVQNKNNIQSITIKIIEWIYENQNENKITGTSRYKTYIKTKKW